MSFCFWSLDGLWLRETRTESIFDRDLHSNVKKFFFSISSWPIPSHRTTHIHNNYCWWSMTRIRIKCSVFCGPVSSQCVRINFFPLQRGKSRPVTRTNGSRGFCWIFDWKRFLSWMAHSAVGQCIVEHKSGKGSPSITRIIFTLTSPPRN